jgi:hypothetical protein
MLIRLDENLFLHDYYKSREAQVTNQIRWLKRSLLAVGGCFVASFFAGGWEQTLILFACVLASGYGFQLKDRLAEDLFELRRKEGTSAWLTTHSARISRELFERARTQLGDYEGDAYVYYRGDDLREPIVVGLPNVNDWVHFRLKFL